MIHAASLCICPAVVQQINLLEADWLCLSYAHCLHLLDRSSLNRLAPPTLSSLPACVDVASPVPVMLLRDILDSCRIPLVAPAQELLLLLTMANVGNL